MHISATPCVHSPQALATPAITRAGSTAAAAEAQTPVPRELPPLRLIQGKDLPQARADFAGDLGKLLRSAGISVPPDPVLTMDYVGKVVVANNHSDKARIEQVFEDEPEMRNRFAELSAAHSLQRAVEGHDGFVAAYDRLQGSPAAQAALVRDRIAHNKAPFFMTIGAEGAEPFFGVTGRVWA